MVFTFIIYLGIFLAIASWACFRRLVVVLRYKWIERQEKKCDEMVHDIFWSAFAIVLSERIGEVISVMEAEMDKTMESLKVHLAELDKNKVNKDRAEYIARKKKH